jgi:hypothetical protein
MPHFPRRPTDLDRRTIDSSTDISSPPKPENRQLPLSVEWVLLVLLTALFVWHAFLPAWRTLNSDFPNYYLAASLYRRGVPLDRVYEWTWFQRQNDLLRVRDGIVGFAPNPPICALPLAPLTALRPLAAKRVWLILNLGFLALALWVLRKVTKLVWRRLALIASLCIVPLHSNFLLGQFYVLVLLLLCTAYYASVTGRRFTSGGLLALATALKLFPILFLFFFLGKRNWRAVAGFILGGVVLAAVSVVTLGVEVHRVFLWEVLSQISRGDWLAPYELWRNSFITLWSHLFLFEPELNPSPLRDSVALYSLAMAATVTVLLLGFVLSTRNNDEPAGSALEWAALVSLSLLLSSTTGSYHPTVLIFTAIVAFDVLLGNAAKGRALAFLLLFVIACAPIPAVISKLFPLTRLVATVALYVMLLSATRVNQNLRVSGLLLVGILAVFLGLTILNLRSLRSRAEDFQRRLPSSWSGLRASNPVAVAGRVAIVDMQQKKYSAVVLQGGDLRSISLDGDALSIGGANDSSLLYVEVVGSRSSIMRLPIEPRAAIPVPLLEGHDPAVSGDGKWLAFVTEKNGQPEVWLSLANLAEPPKKVLAAGLYPLEVTVSSVGDVISAVGSVSHPHLVLVKHETGVTEVLTGADDATRCPAISPDGKRLAFSRRPRGSWQLIARELVSGAEQQLTHSSCNATSAAWQDSQTLLYATDCGRGVGLSAIARVVLP